MYKGVPPSELAKFRSAFPFSLGHLDNFIKWVFNVFHDVSGRLEGHKNDKSKI